MPQCVQMSPKTIQFADDTVIISEANPITLKIITRILMVYEELTGLKINRAKSVFVPIAIPQELNQVVQNILHSPPDKLPIKYLGLPLSIKKPKIIDFQPMIQAIQRRMEGWKSNFLSYGGRVILVKAVLSAIPLHFMQATTLPKGVIQQIDRLRRNFLWRGNGPCKGINCLVNWETVCNLKENGGMGVISLESQNQALLTKWVWRLQHDHGGLWANTIRQLYGYTEVTQLRGTQQPSFFLKELSQLVPLFVCSTEATPITLEI